MTDRPNNPSFESIPSAIRHPSHRARLPLVWLVPVVAALIGGWIAVHAILERGPSVTVTFLDAEGIEAGKTKVRYKSVDVGDVKFVTIAPDHRTVKVTLQAAKFAEPFLVAGTRFWVVRPRLGASGVSGLGTLLSGSYIAMDAGNSSAPVREFVGSETPPVIAGNTPGKEFLLDSPDLHSLGVGAPAYFHHIPVGQISAVALNPDGHGLTLRLFVNAPYDRFVTEDTRFWHASGVDIELNSGGVRVQAESVSTILAGGVAFESPPGSDAKVPSVADSRFQLSATREVAMKSPDRVVETYILYFKESLRGLAPGAVVDFRGVGIGEVISLDVEYDRAGQTFQFPVLVNIYPERIRSRYRPGADKPSTSSHELVSQMIGQGFRAQLRSSSLLTGQLYIALDFFPQAPRVNAQPELTPMPLPTLPGNLEEIQTALVSVAHKLDQLPLAKLATDLDVTLTTLNQTLASTHSLVARLDTDILPEAKSALGQTTRTLAQAQMAVAPEASLQNDLHATLGSVSRAADSVRVLADYLDRHPEALIRGKVADSK